MLQNKQKIHFIGIAGVGMSAIAVMLKKEGYEISGSDEEFYDPIKSYVEKAGIEILTPHKAKNIPEGVDTIIIGKHAKLTKANPEVAEAFERHENKIKSYPEFLKEVTKNRENTVVCGSYGKSTCTSLLAWCLQNGGIDTGYFVGAMSPNLETSAKMGSNKNFILEGDEYPTSNWDMTSKFLYLNAHNVLLTSCEHDHINIFKTEEMYIDPYRQLMRKLPEEGLLVANTENPNVKEVAIDTNAEMVTYSMSENTDWYPKNINFGKETTFDLYKHGEKITSLKTQLLGTHNIENIVGVSAFLLEKKLIDKKELQKSVESFKGPERRIDLKTTNSEVLVYEGFGSSYTKARTVFDALRIHFKKRRIVTVFEPHTFSWRNKKNLHWYEDVFDECSEVIIFSPPTHGAGTHEQATLEEITNKVKECGVNATSAENKEVTKKLLEEKIKEGDILVLMTSGSMNGMIPEVTAWAEEKFKVK